MVSLRGLGADPDCSPEILLLSPENPLHLSDKDAAQGPQICRPGLSGDILLGPYGYTGKLRPSRGRTHSPSRGGVRIHADDSAGFLLRHPPPG